MRGIGDACRALEAPIIGGNVSLYNEGPEGPIYPTPVVGMVGRLPDAAAAGRLGFARDGDAIAVCGPFDPRLPGSELAKLRGEALPDGLPAVDLDRLARAAAAVRAAVRGGAVASAHDVAEGGLAVAVAESCLAGGIGARVDLGAAAGDPLARLFGEGPGGYVISGERAALEALASDDLAVVVCGEVGGDRITVACSGGGIDVALADARSAWADGLAGAFD